MDDADQGTEPIRKTIVQIWQRARTNAFAHKCALIQCKKADTLYFILTLVASLLSILCIMIVYMSSTDAVPYFEDKESAQDSIQIIFTFASVVFAVVSLFFEIIRNHRKFGKLTAEHEMSLNSYQYISQRAREIDWPEKPYGEAIELLKDLERDFAVLKASRVEPEDHHFEKAHKLMKKIRSDDFSKSSQSFTSVANNPSKE